MLVCVGLTWSVCAHVHIVWRVRGMDRSGRNAMDSIEAQLAKASAGNARQAEALVKQSRRTLGAARELYSDRALAKQAAAAEKEARGEKLSASDLLGIIEPNPDLPDCQSWDIDSDVKCSLPNHHEGEHRAEVTW